MIRSLLALLSVAFLNTSGPWLSTAANSPAQAIENRLLGQFPANEIIRPKELITKEFHVDTPLLQRPAEKVAENATNAIRETNSTIQKFAGVKVLRIADSATANPPKESSATAKKVRIVLVGDSTVAKGSGWGPAFEKLLTPDTECINAAIGGRSSKSYRDEGHWEPALAHHPDYLLLQFGHNDQPGKGPERETDPNTTYYANMARYVDEARAAGIKPILVTSMARRTFSGTKIQSTLTPYVDAVKKLAAEKHVPLVDLHARSIEQLEKMGPEAAAVFDPPLKEGAPADHTHLGVKGGELVAPLVVDELRKVVPELAPHFVATP